VAVARAKYFGDFIAKMKDLDLDGFFCGDRKRRQRCKEKPSLFLSLSFTFLLAFHLTHSLFRFPCDPLHCPTLLLSLSHQVTITVPLAAEDTPTKKELCVDVQRNKAGDHVLRVSVRGKDIINGVLFQQVETDEVTWTLNAGDSNRGKSKAPSLIVLLTMTKKMTWLDLLRSSS
jgi:hypothetical protein